MSKENKIPVKVYTFDLTGGASPGAARHFCSLVLNYGLIRQHFSPDIYDITTGKGEQRESIKTRVKKLRKAIIDHTFYPTEILACALPEHIEKLENGDIEIKFSDKPLPILNGFQRREALEIIRAEGKGGPLERLVDNLPFPVNISLDPERRKEDFLNTNSNLPIHKAHMLQLKIDTNTVDHRYAPYFKRARELALALFNNDKSPFYDVIQFDQTSTAPLNANVLMTERKTDQIMSFFGSAKLLQIMSKDNEWFVNVVLRIFDLIANNTKACNDGKLMEFPTPEAGKYKAGASFFIGVVNQVIYYMYLKNKDSIDTNLEKLLLKSVAVFEDDVDGDTSSKRRATLMREFAQSLFEDIVEDPNSVIGGHFGIPYTLITFFSPGCFGVDAPSIPKAPTTTVKRGKKKKNTKVKLDNIQPVSIIDNAKSVRADSDTGPDWTDEI